MVKKRKNFSKAAAIVVIIVAANITVLYLGATPMIPLMWSIGGMGAITFFGTLILANLLSRSRNLDKGEIRKSITASLLVVYFVLISFIACTDCDVADSKYAETIIHSFTGIVGIMVAFYFGTRAVDAWKSKSAPESTESTTSTTSTADTTDLDEE